MGWGVQAHKRAGGVTVETETHTIAKHNHIGCDGQDTLGFHIGARRGMLNAESIVPALELKLGAVLATLEDVLAQADIKFLGRIGLGEFLRQAEDVGFAQVSDFHDYLVLNFVGVGEGQERFSPKVKVDFLASVHRALNLVEVAKFKNLAPKGVSFRRESLAECRCAQVKVHSLNISKFCYIREYL